MPDSQKHTLLLRLAGPLQSWGTSSRWTDRDTGQEPSKSGVIGILAAARGYHRDEPLDDLAALRMGVRVDQEGVPGYDFQTAGAGDDHPGIAQAMDSQAKIDRRLDMFARGEFVRKGASSISRRHFLQDAIFLVGLEGDDPAFLHSLDAHLRRPVFPIGLGRRSYVPSVPVAIPGGGVREHTTLDAALQQEPLLADLMSRMARKRVKREFEVRRRIILETTGEASAIRVDQPIGAAFQTRVFGPRPVRFDRWPVTFSEDDTHARN